MKALLVGIGESGTMVAKVLGARGHEVIVAADGARALDDVRRHSPALVVVEDPLSDMTAAEFCGHVRGCPAGMDAVILVITAHQDDLPALLEAGATDLYTTSLGPAALETRVLIAERLVAEHARLRDRELRFRRLFDSGVAGVTISDLDGNFKEANAAFLRMLGYTREDMLAGKLNWEVITPLDHLVPNAEDRAQLQATGFLPLREREYVHKDGHHIAALVGPAALEGTSECISYVTDISARKRGEEALRASETQYRALFDESPSPKFLYDYETLAFLAVNDAAVAHYGYSRVEFLGMTLNESPLPGGRSGLLAAGRRERSPLHAGGAVEAREEGRQPHRRRRLGPEVHAWQRAVWPRCRAGRDRPKPDGTTAPPGPEDGGHRPARRRASRTTSTTSCRSSSATARCSPRRSRGRAIRCARDLEEIQGAGRARRRADAAAPGVQPAADPPAARSST